ncbi:aromatic alcohol reductase [Pedobacter sp. 22163]|uniref:aromatic alcohol reductase n=1 Tax=Pedobacter sp. 22163 TaxID=3453883 RepID=UPI003F8607C3
MENKAILILGAGELGMPVIRNIAHESKKYNNVKVTVLLRGTTIESDDEEKKRNVDEIRSLGASLLAADLSAPSSDLISIFKNFDVVISCTGYGSGAGGFQLKLANAVLDAGVKRYLPWQFGVDFDVIGRGSAQDLFDEQLDVRELLRSQNNTEWIIISTGMFTSYLFERSFGLVDFDKKIVNVLGSPDTAVTVTTPEDIGKLTSAIFFAEPQIKNTIVYIGGDTITYGQFADVIDSLSGEKFERTVSDINELKNDLKNDPTNFVKKYRSIFGDGRGVSWELEKTFNFQHSIKTTSARQWAENNIEWNK